MMRIGSSFESIFCCSRGAILATVATSLVTWGIAAHAQSPDPVKLREIIQSINAAAAAQTFSPQALSAPAGTPPPPPVQIGNPAMMSQIGQINAQAAVDGWNDYAEKVAEAAATAAAAESSPAASAVPQSSGSGIGYSPDSSAPASTTTPNPVVAGDPSAQDAAAPSTPHDSLAEPVTPTSAPVPATEPVPPTSTPLPATEPRPATVTYDAGLLTIHAEDSSLSMILRQIGRLTGMTITGGVSDERVFGDYGPSKPSTILSTLVDGSRTNMILRAGPDATIKELILTPRVNGGAPASRVSGK